MKIRYFHTIMHFTQIMHFDGTYGISNNFCKKIGISFFEALRQVVSDHFFAIQVFCNIKWFHVPNMLYLELKR